MKTSNRQSGFTLIETVIYLALFSLLFCGAVVGVYSIMETSGNNKTRAMMQEEGEFLLAKINWAVSEAQSISVPSNGRMTLATTSGTLDFIFDGAAAQLSLNSQPLNNSATQVAGLYFDDIPANGGQPEGVKTGFAIKSLTPNGAALTSDFASTIYLRK